MNKTLRITIFILFVAAILCACSGNEFPTGTFTHQNLTVEFMEDGTYKCLEGDEVITEGTYAIQDYEITWLTCRYCEAQNSGPATYRWQLEDGVLSFELIGDDFCGDRRVTLLEHNWFGPE